MDTTNCIGQVEERPTVKCKKTSFTKEILKSWELYILLLPGALLLLILNYLPMFGILIAFKDYKFYENNFIINFFKSEWVGIKNFMFFLSTPDRSILIRNTVLYNFTFIIVGTLFAVFCAIVLNELNNKKLSKLYQTSMLLPYFLSWIIISYLFFAFLSMDKGILNTSIFKALGIGSIEWYTEPRYWPFLLVFANLLKYGGYNCIIYIAAIAGIDPEYYEAAVLDGASKGQQIMKVTLPLLSPTIIIMVLLALGRIFNADFGLFFQVPLDSGALYNATNVFDTYVYRALMNTGNISMSSAAGLFQSAVGFILILTSNLIVSKIDNEKTLF